MLKNTPKNISARAVCRGGGVLSYCVIILDAAHGCPTCGIRGLCLIIVYRLGYATFLLLLGFAISEKIADVAASKEVTGWAHSKRALCRAAAATAAAQSPISEARGIPVFVLNSSIETVV